MSWFIDGVRMSEQDFKEILNPDCLSGGGSQAARNAAWDAYEQERGYPPCVWFAPTDYLCGEKRLFGQREDRLFNDILKLWAYAYFHFGNGYKEYKSPLTNVVMSRVQDADGEVRRFWQYLEKKKGLVGPSPVQNWFLSHCWMFDGRKVNNPEALCGRIGLDRERALPYISGLANQDRGETSQMVRIAMKYIARPMSFDRYVEDYCSECEPFVALWNNPAVREEFLHYLSVDGLRECQPINDTVAAYKASSAFRRTVDMYWRLDRSHATFNILLAISIESVNENLDGASLAVRYDDGGMGVELYRSTISDGECVFPLTAFLSSRSSEGVDGRINDFRKVRVVLRFSDGREEQIRIDDDVAYGYERLFAALSNPEAATVCCSHSSGSSESRVLATWGDRGDRQRLRPQGVGAGVWIVGASREIVDNPAARGLPQFGEVGAVYVPLAATHNEQEFNGFGLTFRYHKLRGAYSYEGVDEDLWVANAMGERIHAFSGDLYRAVHDSGSRPLVERRPMNTEDVEYWSGSDSPRCLYVPASLKRRLSSCSGGGRICGSNWSFSCGEVEEWVVRSRGWLEGALSVSHDGRNEEFILRCRMDYADAYCCLRHGDAYSDLSRISVFRSFEEMRGRILCVTLPKQAADASCYMFRKRLHGLAPQDIPVAEAVDGSRCMYNPQSGFIEFPLTCLFDGIRPDEQLYDVSEEEIQFGTRYNFRSLVRLTRRPSSYRVVPNDSGLDVYVPESPLSEGSEEGLLVISEAILNTNDELREHPSYCMFIPFGSKDLPRGRRSSVELGDMPIEYDAYAYVGEEPYRRAYLDGGAYDSFADAFEGTGDSWIRVRRGSGLFGVSIVPNVGALENRMRILDQGIDGEGHSFEASRKYLRGVAKLSNANEVWTELLSERSSEERPYDVIVRSLQNMLDKGMNFLSDSGSAQAEQYDGWWNPNTFLGTFFKTTARLFLPEKKLKNFNNLKTVSGKKVAWILKGEMYKILEALLSKIKTDDGWCDGKGIFPAAVAIDFVLNRKTLYCYDRLPSARGEEEWNSLGIKEVGDLTRRLTESRCDFGGNLWSSEYGSHNRWIAFVHSENFRDQSIEDRRNLIDNLAGFLEAAANKAKDIPSMTEFGRIPTLISCFAQELKEYSNRETAGKTSVCAIGLLVLGARLRAHLGARLPADLTSRLFPSEFDAIMLDILSHVFDLKVNGDGKGWHLLMRYLIATDIMFYELRRAN